MCVRARVCVCFAPACAEAAHNVPHACYISIEEHHIIYIYFRTALLKLGQLTYRNSAAAVEAASPDI